MKSLYEYLSTQKISKEHLPNKMPIEEYIVHVLREYFGETEEDSIEKLVEYLVDLMHRYDMEKFRVFGNCEDSLKFSKKYKNCVIAQPFESLYADREYLYEDVDSSLSEYEKDYDEVEDYIVSFSDDFVRISYDDKAFVFESLNQEKEININPKISTYHSRHETYVELSSRKIVSELNDIPEIDVFWNNYNDIVQTYIDLANEKFGIEFSIFGNGGRHVCVKPTFKLFHEYDEILDGVNIMQDDLKKDAQDEIDYINDELANANKD